MKKINPKNLVLSSIKGIFFWSVKSPMEKRVKTVNQGELTAWRVCGTGSEARVLSRLAVQ